MQSVETAPMVAIACGGTGGHLFPGLAVAELLVQHGCAVSLLVSPKEVDQQAVISAVGMEIVTVPAVGLIRGSVFAFLRGFWRSYRLARRMFKSRRPAAVLAMGGFTSAAPILAGKDAGAATFLHESNSVPGRANRWLAPKVDHVFVGFPEAAKRRLNPNLTVTGTPVRPQFREREAAGSRVTLGLDAGRPTLLVMGGSQGASAINNLVIQSLPSLAARLPLLQFLHLTGANDFEKARAAYAAHKLKAIVRPFLTEMELALGAATAAISRSGASSLAELAAMRLPAILVPYPAAADNHQFFNAKALVETGAARLLEQRGGTTDKLIEMVGDLIENDAMGESMRAALAKWHRPDAAERIAVRILTVVPNDVADVSGAQRANPSAKAVHRLFRVVDATISTLIFGPA